MEDEGRPDAGRLEAHPPEKFELAPHRRIVISLVDRDCQNGSRHEERLPQFEDKPSKPRSQFQISATGDFCKFMRHELLLKRFRAEMLAGNTRNGTGNTTILRSCTKMPAKNTTILTLDTALPYYWFMFTIVESSLFSRLVFDYLSEEEYEDLKLFLALNPESGDVIPGSGGLRKLRWIRTGRGKRGGVRVIYFLRTARGEIALLTLYAKSRRQHPSPYRETIEGGI